MAKLIVILFTLLILFGCTPVDNTSPNIIIAINDNAPKPIQIAAEDLKQDIQASLPAKVKVIKTKTTLPSADYYFFVGQIANLSVLDQTQLTDIQQQNPGARGGIIKRFTKNDRPLIVLTGEDIQGTQYTVYDYAHKVLGTDPLEYWTGQEPNQITQSQLTSIENMVIAPPVIPFLVYFENDVDELANLKAPMLEYDWESFTEMIDSLVRLRYNGIEFFDMLGRVEFYSRPEYIEAHPNYQLDVDYLNRMMDYVHDKGMYIQIDMMMGRQLQSLSMEASNCWKKYKQTWLDTWEVYLTDTPVKKADIFALRPRNQVLDWEYKSSCGEDKAQVFNEVYVELGKIIDKHKPGATRVCTCYHDGMEIFNEDFSPPKDFIIAWSDNGWGAFDYLPKDTKGFKFGTYMHAGFWLNHDVHDPYPELVEETMDMMYNNYGATEYMMVNGQTFRPFMLNIEAFAESARLGTKFDGEQFYLDWATRYLGKEAAPDAVKAMKLLHDAHFKKVGYVEILWQVKKMTAYLSNQLLQRPGKNAIPIAYDGVTKYFGGTAPRIAYLDQASAINQRLLDASPNNVFLHDHFVLPVEMYRDLLVFNKNLIELSKLKGQYEKQPDKKIKQQARIIYKEAVENLNTVYERRLKGDRDSKWETWYDPKKRRPNNGFPSKEGLQKIGDAIENSW